MVDRRALSAVFIGGALGTLFAREAVEAFGRRGPWATFLVNVVGVMGSWPLSLDAGGAASNEGQKKRGRGGVLLLSIAVGLTAVALGRLLGDYL